MPQILMVSGKGGTGKTTLAFGIALTLNEAGKTFTIIDHDPQKSLTALLNQLPLPARRQPPAAVTIVDTPPRTRTRAGMEQNYLTRHGADAQRARRATANRHLTVLKAALNRALQGIPPEQVRYHTCYGINEGPRIHESNLTEIIEYVLEINAGSFSFEAANPRHEHEYHLFERIKMPDGKIPMLQSRLLRRIRELKLQSLEEYREYLFSDGSDGQERVHFIDAVTTNKTDFFREPKHF